MNKYKTQYFENYKMADLISKMVNPWIENTKNIIIHDISYFQDRTTKYCNSNCTCNIIYTKVEIGG